MIRRSRPPAKLAPTGGLTLYSGTGPWDGWVSLLYLEKGVDDARQVMVVPGKFNEDLLVLNPEQRLPALADRDVFITGERVIAEYLDERYPHPRLLPTDPAGRARVRMVLERFASELFPALKAAAAPKANAKDKAHLLDLVKESGRWFAPRGYFTGPEYSQADAAWVVWLKGVLQLKLPLPEASVAYLERLAKRKAVLAFRKA